MLKEQAKVLTRITKIVDLFMIFAAFALAYTVRFKAGELDHFAD